MKNEIIKACWGKNKFWHFFIVNKHKFQNVKFWYLINYLFVPVRKKHVLITETQKLKNHEKLVKPSPFSPQEMK